MVGGACGALYFALGETAWLVEVVCGAAISLALAPIVHELGHIAFAKANKMQIVYCKCFCFRFFLHEGKLRFSFCNPFADDETQVVPRGLENMQKRAALYAAGGLIFGGALCLVVLAAGLALAFSGVKNFLVWGLLPYTAYLFLLNAAPAEYPSGKTDASVLIGLKKGEPAETAMVAVMRVHGALSEGKTFTEIEEKFFDFPVLAMDEPLFVAMHDLRYCRFIQLQDYENAFDCLKRIAAAKDYLSDEDIYELEREIAYISLLGGNDEPLKKSTQTDGEFWQSDEVKAKRILALYSALAGEKEKAETLARQGKELLYKIPLAGVRKYEEILLDRIFAE